RAGPGRTERTEISGKIELIERPGGWFLCRQYRIGQIGLVELLFHDRSPLWGASEDRISRPGGCRSISPRETAITFETSTQCRSPAAYRGNRASLAPVTVSGGVCATLSTIEIAVKYPISPTRS